MRRMINKFFSRCHLHLQQRQAAPPAEKAVVIRPDVSSFHGKSQMRSQIQQNTPTVLSRLTVIVLAAESLLLALVNFTSTPTQSF